MKGKSGLIRCSAAALILSLFVLGSGVCVYGALSSSNIHDNNYVQWASPVYSNLYEDNGALVRVECAGGSVAVEKYDTDGNFLSTVTQFDAPHPIFGGFYQNEKYFYLAFGQNNSGNDDTLDVVFLRQYDKNWNFLRETAVKAIDTRSPFDAGSLRMAEAKGMLYVFTCHVMYSGHQANMTLIFDSEDISYIKRSTSPYSSHSFNQFIQTDGSYMYTLDHGDAYPRALMMGKYQAGVSSFYASTKELYNIVGTTGNNATGVSVGGFLLSGDKFYIAGNSIVQDEATYQTDTHRNIFLMTTDKNMSAPSTVWLTNYTKDDGITVKTPSITQLDDGNFIIMWEEYSSSKYITKIAKVSPSGNILRSGQTLAPLSDCRALLCSDGKMRWYVTNSSAPIFYTFDPSTFDVPTTPAEDWNIDANGTLTVGGKGFLPDSPIPWEDQKANIKHVVIKNGVYNVPQNAFKECTALIDADLGNTVSSIGYSAFYGCSALKEIKMPDTLNAVGGSAFYGCSSLTELTLPEGVKSIGSSTFFGCSALSTVHLPSTFTTIDSMGFYGSGITELTLPPSLKAINYAAFWSCGKLKALTVPEGVVTIGQQAFAYSGIKHLALPSSAQNLNSSMLDGCSAANFYCVKGSKAEEFLKNAGKTYAYIGDLGKTGQTEISDVKKILSFAEGTTVSSDIDTTFRADTDLDGKIDILDVIRALNFMETEQ